MNQGAFVTFGHITMKYNTERSHLIIPEYGRNVQKMVDHCTALPDKEERNRVAKAIVEYIGNLNPAIRDHADFRHKLWDHLFIMSDFKLDVDSPYPIPVRETFQEKPMLLTYPVKSNKFRHYGNIVRDLMKKAISMEESDPERNILILQIANYMKRSYLQWNKDTVEDEIIYRELEDLSNGKLSARGMELSTNIEVVKNPGASPSLNRKNKNRKKKFTKSKKP